MAKKSEMIGFKTTPEIKAALVNIAEREDRSVGYNINRILQQYLDIPANADKSDSEESK